MTGRYVFSPPEVTKIHNRKLLESAQVSVASGAILAYAGIHMKWTRSTCVRIGVADYHKALNVTISLTLPRFFPF